MANWTRQHEQARQRILELLAELAQPFEDMSPEAVRARRAVPPLEWCSTYLPHYFDRPFAPFHRRMVAAVGERAMPTFVGAFRGAGKSVLMALARPLRLALEGQCPYFLYGSKVQKLAAENMDYVRLELDHNERIRADYGDPQTSGPAEGWTVARGITDDEARMPKSNDSSSGFRHSSFDSVKFEAFGIGMSPRGRRYRQYRPLEFVGDDLEDAELARNPQREQNLWDWMMDEVLPAMEPHDFVFTVLGTMFGPGCMLQRARALCTVRDQDGRPLARLHLQKATRGGRSVWPERFSDQTLSRIRATIGLRNWQRNYTLSPDDPTKPFQPAWLQTYEPGAVREPPLRDNLDVVCFLDPALSEAPSGCPRALVAVGCDRASGERYVLAAWIDRGSPMQMVQKLFEFNDRFRPRLIGIESNGGYALIRPLLEIEMQRRGVWLPVRYVSHRTAKEVRIETLAPQMEAGRWRFPRNPSPGVKTLQEQFLSYPDGFVDGPDACAGCEELLPDGFGPGRHQFRYRTLQSRTDFAYV